MSIGIFICCCCIVGKLIPKTKLLHDNTKRKDNNNSWLGHFLTLFNYYLFQTSFQLLAEIPKIWYFFSAKNSLLPKIWFYLFFLINIEFSRNLEKLTLWVTIIFANNTLQLRSKRAQNRQ